MTEFAVSQVSDVEFENEGTIAWVSLAGTFHRENAARNSAHLDVSRVRNEKPKDVRIQKQRIPVA